MVGHAIFHHRVHVFLKVSHTDDLFNNYATLSQGGHSIRI